MCKVEETDAVSIQEFFADLEDPRSSINRRHLLGDMIVICILGVIAGADGPKAIATWATAQKDWLCKHLELPYGIPSHDTIGRLLALLRPEAFQKCFQGWIASLQHASGIDETEQEIIAIDGKTLRRSHDRRRSLGPLHMVSAWAVRGGISLGQLATAEKSNEVMAIPELLEQIDIRGAVVTIDAQGCQRAIARDIIDGGGDYVLALKGNQTKLFEAVKKYVEEILANKSHESNTYRHQEVVKGHGRTDTLIYYQLPLSDALAKFPWKGLRTIGVAIRRSVQQGKETLETRYYISSLKLHVKRFAKAVRGHWHIENTLHWCLDVTFREDECRVRNRHAADNLSWLKRFAISLIKRHSHKESVAMKRRMAGWNVNFLAQVIGLKTT
jgi:predicted transposase YbfD/YdcC